MKDFYWSPSSTNKINGNYWHGLVSHVRVVASEISRAFPWKLDYRRKLLGQYGLLLR